MQALIIEDERLSANRLKVLIQKIDPDIEVLATLDSVNSSRLWFKDNSPPDILFLDIQLNDGLGFDVLAELENEVPVIFTTAYDNYAIKAFKFNSIDYLLKPIDEADLQHSIEKLKGQLKQSEPAEARVGQDFGQLKKIITGDFKKRFLVKLGDQYRSVNVEDVAYFYYQDGMTYLLANDGKKYPVDYTMDQIEGLLHPLEFFRINRKLVVSLTCIKEIHSYFNSRLLLRLFPAIEDGVIVSRDRVADFKRWMDI